MIKQLDKDRNLVLVLTPAEVGQLTRMVDSAQYGMAFGAGSIPEDGPFYQEMAAVQYLLTDEELVEGFVAPHLNHENDPIDEMRRSYLEIVKAGRAAAIEYGLLSS